MENTPSIIKKINFKYILEFSSTGFFIAVGVSLLIRYSFYSRLDISWYIYNLTPQYLLMSSINHIFTSFLGLLFGILFGIKYRPITQFLIYLILFISFVCWIIWSPYRTSVHISNFILYLLISMFAAGSYTQIKLISNSLNFIENPPKNLLVKFKSELFLLIVMILILIFSPAIVGIEKAEEILKYKSDLNQVLIDKDKTDWRLIEMNGDKALLIRNSQERVFKLIEYKEIKEIIVN